MKQKTIKALLSGLLFACLVLAMISFFTDHTSDAKSNAPCEIDRGSCFRETDDGVTVEFDILPKPVTALSELSFKITVKKNGALLNDADVILELFMPGMFMGRNQPVLKQTAKGRYEGKGFITRCASGRKTWQANILVEKNGKTAVADFVFEVY